MEPGFIFVLGAIGVVAVLLYGYYAKRKRREDLARMAASLGLQYAAEDPFGLVSMPFQLFTKGDGQGTENVLYGTWKDVDLKCFDFWYYDESTDSNGSHSRTYHRFTCAMTELQLDSEPITITEENLFTRLGEHFGFHDVSFESEEFNRRFRVKCDDTKFATDLVDARMMQWLMNGDGWSFELVGPYLLCSCGRVEPTELIPVIGELRAFRDHIPKVAYELHGTVWESEERTSQ